MLELPKSTQRFSRRVALQGLGVSLTLPWLKSLASAAPMNGSEKVQPPTRFVTTFFPLGVNTRQWGAKGDGEKLTFEATLKPLESVKQRVTVLEGLVHPHLKSLHSHAGKVAAVLTGEPGGRDGNRSGISIDQLIANEIGGRTEFRSMALGISPAQTGRGFYDSSISWRGPDKPLAKEVDPRGAFNMLFGDPSWLKRDKSVLDFVLQQAKLLNGRLSAQDQHTLAEYFDGIRELELRINRLEQGRSEWKQEAESQSPVRFHPEDPEGAGEFVDFALFAPENFREHTRLMLDLLVLAFRMDKTRIATFMFDSYGPKYMDFSFIPGVIGQWHALSHHNNTASSMHQYHQINHWHVTQFAWLLEKLDDVREGDGTLLDNTLVLLPSDMWDGNVHNCIQYPLILGGNAGGRIRTGRNLSVKDGSMSRLFLSLADLMGAPLKRFKEATDNYNSELMG